MNVVEAMLVLETTPRSAAVSKASRILYMASDVNVKMIGNHAMVTDVGELSNDELKGEWGIVWTLT